MFKTRNILFLSMLAVLTTTSAQDLLTPSAGLSHSLDYAQALESILLTDHRQYPYSTFYLCKPSFSSEYSLAITKNYYTNGRDSLIYTIATQKIWYTKELYWADKSKRKTKKKVPTQRIAINIPRSTANAIEDLFEAATMTSTHFADNRMGCDGTTYLFCSNGKKAEVWWPEKECRTWRMKTTADSLCQAVINNDKALLERQISYCKVLTKEFRECYPPSALTLHQNTTDTTSGYTIFSNGFSPILDLTFPKDNEIKNYKQLTDTLSLWARELFVNCYDYRVTIHITDSVASCEFRHYQYIDDVDVYIPARLFNHDFIFNALKLPFGNYLLNEKNEWIEHRN